MGRRILRIRAKTTNEVIIGEMGWWTMKARRDLLRLRYWRKIIGMKSSRLTKIAYEEDRKLDEVSWANETKKLLIELNLGYEWETQEKESRWSGKQWEGEIERRITKKRQTNWRKEIQNKVK